jgi:hypothetical protein
MARRPRRHTIGVVLGILARLAAVQSARGAGASGPEKGGATRGRTVSVVVVDQAGTPLPGVMVFTADGARIVAMAQADERGAVELLGPRPRFNFGVLSPSLRLAGVTPRGGGRFDLVTAPLPPRMDGDGTEREIARLTAPRALVFHGKVVDETGVGLRGVRLEAVRATGALVSTVYSGEAGHFALVVPGGEFGLRASAPGLEAARSGLRDGQLVVVMGIAADVQTVTITPGRTLSFRPSDSIDPEYTPPAAVRAWLQFAYGICPAVGPLKAAERRNLKKYWYLDVLREDPPNPASVSGSSCTPPSAFDMRPRGQGVTSGFEIWEDAVIAPPP